MQEIPQTQVPNENPEAMPIQPNIGMKANGAMLNQMTTPTKRNNKFLIVSGITISVLLLVGGVFAYYRYYPSKSVSLDESNKSNDLIVSQLDKKVEGVNNHKIENNITKSDKSGWLEYTGDKYSVEFPNDLEYKYVEGNLQLFKYIPSTKNPDRNAGYEINFQVLKKNKDITYLINSEVDHMKNTCCSILKSPEPVSIGKYTGTAFIFSENGPVRLI